MQSSGSRERKKKRGVDVAPRENEGEDDDALTNSSSAVCQCRCDDQQPGAKTRRLTPNWVRPAALPRRLRRRSRHGASNGTG